MGFAGGGVDFEAEAIGLNGAGVGFVEGFRGFEDAVVDEGALGCGVGCEALGGVVVDEGFEYFAGSAAGGMAFAESSRTLFNIFDVSGVTGVLIAVFAGAGVGFCDPTDGGGLGTIFGGVGEFAVVLDIDFSTT